MVEAFNVMQDRITRARLAGDPPDVMISPRIGRIGAVRLSIAPQEAIALGAEAAERALEGVRRGRGGARVENASYAVAMYSRSASRLALDLLDAPFHHVADRDDADEPALLHHRHDGGICPRSSAP